MREVLFNICEKMGFPEFSEKLKKLKRTICVHPVEIFHVCHMSETYTVRVLYILIAITLLLLYYY